MTIYFIRHTSVNVPKGICYGRTDVPLAETFNEEAAEVAKQLEGIKFDEVYSSPLTRALKLAEFCGFATPIKDNRISEFNFGDWEMKSFDSLYKDDARFRIWCEGNYIKTAAPNGESFAEQMARFVDFIKEKKAEGHKMIAAFCHGGILACALIYSGKAKAENAFDTVPPYGSVISIDV